MRWTHEERQARPPDSAGGDDHWRHRLYCRDGRRRRLAGSIPIAALAVIGAVGYYVWGGRDSDMGAMLGRRVDERQILVRARAQSLAGVAGAAAGLGGYMVAIALKDPVWPFVLILGVEAIAFIAGLAIYGPHGAR